MLRVLFALFAFAVGLSGLGNVDLQELIIYVKFIKIVPINKKPQEFSVVIHQPLFDIKPREERVSE